MWDAYQKVKANKGAAGVDGVTVEEFEKDLKGNLYKVWVRMSSGSYFPPAVLGVQIPKADGGVRMLGVPTVADRVAQTVVAAHLEQRVEPVFHPDSYGYRPGKSALDAVGTCRARCWKKKWAVDLDIAQFFDSVDWDLMLKAVRVHTDAAWVLLYVKRWLAAPLQHPDGTMQERHRGTPQGSAVSPVLANLFLHYAFDRWVAEKFPDVTFERYADDAVVHCGSRRRASHVLEAIRTRMEEVGLRLHPTKTRIVYCGTDRGYDAEPGVATDFTFLGYTFQRRAARDRQGQIFTSFLPAASKDAVKSMSRTVRSWRIHLRVGATLQELARWMNPIVRGWMNYYGAFYHTRLQTLLRRINHYLMRWVRKKYRRWKTFKKFHRRWKQVVQAYPLLFAHWKWVNTIW